jgi:hypothetical protein
MKIMIDLDDTLFNNNILQSVCDNYGVDIDDYKITFKLKNSDLPPYIIDEVNEKFQDPEHMCNLIPNPTVHDFLIDCYSRDITMDIITARSTDLVEPTLDMIYEHFPYQFNEIIFTNGQSKIDMILNNRYDVIIDDNSEEMMELSNAIYDIPDYNPKIFVPNNPNTPHNEIDVPTMLCGFDNIYLIETLIEIEDYIF